MGLDRRLVEVNLQIYEDLYAKLAELGDLAHHVNRALEKYLEGIAALKRRLSDSLEDYWGE